MVVRTRESGRRRRLCVARSSSPHTLRTKRCSSSVTMRGNLPNPAADARPGYTRRMVTVDDVEAALTNVIDPELGLDFVELGLIYGIDIDGGDVHVTFSLTTPACPIGPQVTEQIEEFVGELDGVEQRHVVDGLHAAVVPGPDVRGREVRARLLTSRTPRGPAGPGAQDHGGAGHCSLAGRRSVTL